MNLPVAAVRNRDSFAEQLRPFFPYFPSGLISARCLDQIESVTQHLPEELGVGPFMFECAALLQHLQRAGHAALGTLTSYLAAHTTRLNYCHRLYTGRSIGSGMVEGAAKNLVEHTGGAWEGKVVGFLCAAGGMGHAMIIERAS